VSYRITSHCRCPSKSCANNVTKLVDLCAMSYSQSLIPTASTSTSYSSFHIVLYNFPLSVTRRAALKSHEACRSSRRLLFAIVIATGILINIVLVASYCTTSPCICPSESCANHVPKCIDLQAASYSRSSTPPQSSLYHTRRVVLYNFPLLVSFSQLC